jgi:hypothetical protein
MEIKELELKLNLSQAGLCFELTQVEIDELLEFYSKLAFDEIFEVK